MGKNLVKYGLVITVTLVSVLVGTIAILLMNQPITPSSNGIVNNMTSVSDTYFFIYGQHSCPHCRATTNFLSTTYGPNMVYFCDLEVSDRCRRLFLDFTKPGITYYVPTTFVVYNGTVSGMVVGELTNKGIVDSLMVVNTDTRIPVYYVTGSGLNRVGYIVFNGTHRDFIEKYLNPSGTTDVDLNITFVREG